MVKVNFTLRSRWFIASLLVIFCAVSVSGCASLRKKFTRQKKNKGQTEEFVPVLVPVEYPRPDASPSVVYKNNYIMAKAYFKDLDNVIGSRDSSDKQQLYIFTQLTSRMDLMAEVLADGERKSLLKQLAIQLKDVISRYDKPDAIRRYDVIKSDVHRIERDFYKSFKPALVQEDLKK
jgi:hypothetical protein